jgi:hypothetical protein
MSRTAAPSRLRPKHLRPGNRFRTDDPWSRDRLIVQTRMEPAVDRREHNTQSETPEQLSQQQARSRIATQDRFVGQPLQQGDRAKHPDNEAKRQSKEPAAPRVVGCPLEQPTVEDPTEEHQANIGAPCGHHRCASSPCGFVEGLEHDENRQGRNGGDHTS